MFVANYIDNVKFCENPSSGSGLICYMWTDKRRDGGMDGRTGWRAGGQRNRLDGTNSLFSQYHHRTLVNIHI
jgi:hypothetical protein